MHNLFFDTHMNDAMNATKHLTSNLLMQVDGLKMRGQWKANIAS